MKSEDAVRTIVAQRGNAVIVPTMTAIKWVDKHDPKGLNVSCVPLMGGASALGLGLALACPERTVIVLDGDGSLLMQLPSLVTLASNKDAKIVHVVFNNGVWFENLANLPLPGSQSVQYSDLAKAAGFERSFKIREVEDLASKLPDLLSTKGPCFVELIIEPDAAGLWRKGNPQPDLADFHFNRLGIEIERVRESLASECGR